MSEAVSAAPAERAPGLPATLAGLYFSPLETFRRVVSRPRWVTPLLVFVALNTVFLAVWMRKVDPREFMRNQMEESGMVDRFPPEQMGEILDRQTRAFPVMGWVSGLLAPPLVCLVLAGIFLFIFRFGFGGDVTFAQSVVVVVWSFLAVRLLTGPLMMVVLHLKGDWNLDPGEALQASPAALLERNEVPKALYALAGSLDLFTLWTVVLLSAGYAAVLGRPFTTGLTGVGFAWFVLVILKVAFAALLSMA